MTRACSHLRLDKADYATKVLPNTLCSPEAKFSRSAQLAPHCHGKTQLSKQWTLETHIRHFRQL